MATPRHILIGICGGSGCGKTVVARRIVEELGSREVVVLEQDAYYRDLAHLPMEERAATNFDHPDAVDIELLTEHLESLLQGRPVDIPVYDFVAHTRTDETITISDHRIIVLEGIMVFWFERLRELMDIKIYVDAPDDIRLMRRVRRDTIERGRELEQVLEQYENFVRPMHLSFVERSRHHADIIIPRGGHNRIAIDIIKTKIDELLRTTEN